MTTDTAGLDRPACQGPTPGHCSNCAMSYDCARVRGGSGRLSWALVVLAFMAVLVVLSRAAGGA